MDAQRQTQVSDVKTDTVLVKKKKRRKAALISVSVVKLPSSPRVSDQNHAEAVGGDPGDRHPDAGVWRPHATGGF